jgi:hypothetical protein
LREKYRKEFNEYQRNQQTDNFQSKRPKTGEQTNTKDDGPGSHTYRAYKYHDDAAEWNQIKALRRYRYAHLRNKSTVPMSIKNEDRLGLANLQHERVKTLDKLHVPPILVFALLIVPAIVFISQRVLLEDEAIEKLQEKNLLLAVKKTQQQIEYGEDEITGSEELTIASTQFKEVVEKRKAKEQRILSDIKKTYLTDGLS